MTVSRAVSNTMLPTVADAAIASCNQYDTLSSSSSLSEKPPPSSHAGVPPWLRLCVRRPPLPPSLPPALMA